MKSAPLVWTALLSSLLWGAALGLYDHMDEVFDLRDDNFESMVLNSDFVWIVEFYAPWCGHCKALAPEYKKAAAALKGIVRVGAVDADTHKQYAQRYQVKGFPTLKVFGANKQSPSDYQGARTADGIVSEALNTAKSVATERLRGKGGGGGGGGSKSSGGGSGGGAGDVVTLTDSNFEELVIKSNEMWLVEFFAPWCGHCKNLAPHWASAATKLRGKVKLGAVDATVEKVIASRYQIQGFPTIKMFPSGPKDWDKAEDYAGGRTGDDIVQWALEHYTVNLPPPEVHQLTSQEGLKECGQKQLCMIAFLPHILDSLATGRNAYIEILKDAAEKYKQRPFGWVWAEGGTYPELERRVEIGGFGYPALTAINSRKDVYSTLRGAFGMDGISEFIRDLVGGRGAVSMKQQLPEIITTEPWDGKDGELPVDEEWDLSDLDDVEGGKKDEL